MENSLFAGYESLAIDTTPIHPDWGAISRTVPTMTISQKQDIAKLILEHWRLNLLSRMTEEDAIDCMRKSSIPFSGKSGPGGRGVIFNVNKLPAELQLIIAKCVVNCTKKSK